MPEPKKQMLGTMEPPPPPYAVKAGVNPVLGAKSVKFKTFITF